MDISMFPMLAVALLIWFGLFAFLLYVDRRVSGLEQDLKAAQDRQANAERTAAR